MNRVDLPDAADLDHQEATRTAADDWLEKQVKMIQDYGGDVDARVKGSHGLRQAIMLGSSLILEAAKRKGLDVKPKP